MKVLNYFDFISLVHSFIFKSVKFINKEISINLFKKYSIEACVYFIYNQRANELEIESISI